MIVVITAASRGVRHNNEPIDSWDCNRDGHIACRRDDFAGIYCSECEFEIPAADLRSLGYVPMSESVTFLPDGMTCGCGRFYSVYQLSHAGIEFPRNAKDEELAKLEHENRLLRERLGEQLVDQEFPQ